MQKSLNIQYYAPILYAEGIMIKYHVTLTAEERTFLETLLKKRKNRRDPYSVRPGASVSR
jgi:hypothetical protein